MLIDAQTIDPASLRLRTWVNGELAQEGTSSEKDLIFPLAQFVADLSQHMTLETGDIILTGTPAGSTVIKPGDVVEVEVDVPGGETSGRLKTAVVEIPASFDSALGNLPNVDDKQREDAYGDRESAGLPPLPSSSSSELSAELKRKLEEAPTAGLSAQLRNRGINQSVIEGVYPQTPGTKMVGVARTLRFVAGREDLFKSHGGGFNEQKKVFDTVKEGEVIVIEARQEPGSGTLGDILALRAKTAARPVLSPMAVCATTRRSVRSACPSSPKAHTHACSAASTFRGIATLLFPVATPPLSRETSSSAMTTASSSSRASWLRR